MFEGVETGISLIRAERAALRRNGLALAFRPLLCLITDGAPTDLNGGPTHRLPEVRERLRAEERDHNLVFSAIGVDGADHRTLRSLAGVGGYYKLARAAFIQALTLITASADHLTTIGSEASAVDIHRTAGAPPLGHQLPHRGRPWRGAGSGVIADARLTGLALRTDGMAEAVLDSYRGLTARCANSRPRSSRDTSRFRRPEAPGDRTHRQPALP